MNKLIRYLHEIDYCFRTAADRRSGWRLAAGTLAFHWSNLRRAGINRDNQSLRRYRIGDACTDLWLRTLGGDFFVFFEIFMDEVYRLPNSWLVPGGTIVDLGANIGLASRYLDRAMPGARFICVEPNPSNYAVLEKNSVALGNRCVLECAAVGAEAGIAVLEQAEVSWATHVSARAEGGLRTPVVTMNELVQRHGIDRIDILKVDIEGAERDLFAANLEWLALVQVIVIELHGAYTEPRFAADLKGHGFELVSPAAGQGNRMLAAVNTSSSRACCVRAGTRSDTEQINNPASTARS